MGMEKKQKNFLWIRGIVSIGYVVTAIAIYRFVQICVDNQSIQYDLYRSYVHYQQLEIEVNILFSIGVVILFIVTWLFFKIDV